MLGRIYKLKDDKDMYIGSTFSTLNKRLGQHKGGSRYNTLLYKAMKERGVDTFIIELIEEINVNHRDELREREDYWIRTLNPSLNKNRSLPYIKYPERKAEVDKEYRDKNREHIRKRVRDYYAKNKDILNEKKREQVLCNKCNQFKCKAYMTAHLKICGNLKVSGRKKGDKSCINNLLPIIRADTK